MERMPDYCDMWIGDWMRAQPGYLSYNWREFCKEVRKEFKDQDIDQQVHTRSYLERYKSQSREWDAKTKDYVREYTAISAKVFTKGHIDEFTRTLWFLQGLPEKLSRRVVKKKKIDIDKPDTMRFNEVREEVMEMILTVERNEKMFAPEKHPVEVSQLAEAYGRSDRDVMDNGGSASTASKEIDQLTRQLEALTLPIRAIANQGDARVQNPSQKSAPARGTTYQGRAEVDVMLVLWKA